MYLDNKAVQLLRGLMIFCFLIGLILIGVTIVMFVEPDFLGIEPAAGPVLLVIGATLVGTGVSCAVTYLLIACVVLAIEQAATEIKNEMRLNRMLQR
ncbi:hypothetical protein PQI23_13795 [Leucobacter sp. USCH14]|uniref:hypothetical protein n=1 Tax=Leucobacter sp. USCH14 TaxID=3024838 RepID=UPI0030B58852